MHMRLAGPAVRAELPRAGRVRRAARARGRPVGRRHRAVAALGGADDYFEFGIFPGLTPRFYSLTEEVKLTAPGEGKSLPFGGLHALRKNEEACSITLTAISALNAAACDSEPVSSD